jgi:signal transduction histidine kinase
MINLYQNKERLKWIIVGVSLLVGVFSLIYTNRLVQQLANRELRQISLFAKSLEFMITSENDEEINFVLTEIVNADNTIPLIWADANGEPIEYDNLNVPAGLTPAQEREFLLAKIEEMKMEYDPIHVKVADGLEHLVYYANSNILRQLKYFSYVQVSVISLLALLSYVVFSSTRKLEQDRVWVGLAKETAHQLGTPISSLMAWIEYFKSDAQFDQSIIPEITKDVQRLEMITARFSSIGSQPQLKDENVCEVVRNIIAYLEKRVSSKVKIAVIPKFGQELNAKINIPLFEWVIENVCKNAVDAMNGNGKITIYIKNSKDGRFVLLDINDTGKGIPKSKIKDVFLPGYTTKKRGWGLGLTLVKRIVENYHKGKIFVLRSELDEGTTFRVMIPK